MVCAEGITPAARCTRASTPSSIAPTVSPPPALPAGLGRLKCICLVGRPDGGVVETAGEPQSPTRTPGLLCFSDLLL